MTVTHEMSAVGRWKSRVEAHDAQTERVRPPAAGDDYYDKLASGFREDPRRTDDPVVERLAEWVKPGTTVIDVGGGAGRYALPLAVRGASVTVVDPSPAMIAALREAAEDAGVSDLGVVEAGWDEADVAPADIVFCANVVYFIADIEPFVRKLAESGRQRAAILAYMKAPPSVASPLWEPVHGETRIDLPALPELLPALWEMNIHPNVEMFPPSARRLLTSREAAAAWARRLLWVEPGSEKEMRLEAALNDLIEETPEGFTLRGARTRPQGLVWWSTE
jgi:SAM-dependent methyltransferase